MARQRPAERPRPTIDELASACRAAGAVFTPRTEADLKRAEGELRAAVARLDARLKAAGPGGDAWRAFLRWETLKEELARGDGPRLEPLDAVYEKYDSGHNGLNLIWFADVRRALRSYLTTARAIGNPKIKDYYEAMLAELPDYLEDYHASPTTDKAFRIAAAVGWLEETGQAIELIEAIRGYFSHPNLQVHVSADVIGAGFAMPVDETEPLRDVIMGANIYGTGHITGQVSVELVPAAEHAEMNALLRGTVDSETVGYKGPARVYSDSVTQITSRKPFLVDADRIWSLPARSRAVTSTTITNVRVTRCGRCLKKLAWRRALSQKSQAERIGARHAERRINRRVDEQAGQWVEQAGEVYREKFRKPLLERRLFPQLLRFHTTDAALHVTGLHGGPFGLGAPNPPPTLEEEHDLAVRLHESAVNNFMASAFAGMILKEEEFQSRATELLGSLPEALKPDEEEEPWGITFAREQPISATFVGGGFSVTLRGVEYSEGDKDYPGMNVTAVYEIQKTQQGFKAVRQGELQIFPPGFVPGGEKKLTSSQTVLRSLLEKRFGKIFEEELVVEDLSLPGRWDKAGQLALTRWEASDGWMLLAWKRIPPTPDAAGR